MAITWKAGLPTTYLQDDYNEGYPDLILQSPTDSGGVFKRRLKATAGYMPLVVSMKYTTAQKIIFDNFLTNDLKFGVLPVDFPTATYETTATTVEAFIMTRTWKPVSGTTWILTLNLMVLLTQT